MKNFKVGDKARVKYTRNRADNNWYVGVIVTILSIQSGISNSGNPFECTVTLRNGQIAYPKFDQLEPITKPKMGSWKRIEAFSNWNPAKEKVL